MIDEVIEIFLMSLRSESLSPNPLDLVPLVGGSVVSHLLPCLRVPVVGEQKLSLLINVSIKVLVT